MRYQKSLFLTQNRSTLIPYDKLTISLSHIWKRTFLSRYFVTLVTYSDSRLFFQYKISPLFSTDFQKVGRRLRNATVIPNLRLYQTITDISFDISLMIQYFIWAIWLIQDLRIRDENVNFIIFHFLGKCSEIEHRLHRLYWTLRCFGIGNGLNWRCYSSLKPTAFIEISHFQNSMLN